MKNVLESLLVQARTVFEASGHHSNIMLVHVGDQVSCVAIIYNSPDAKDKHAALVKQIMREPDFQWIALIMEAWYSEATEEVLAYIRAGGRLQDRPEARQEQLLVNFVNRSSQEIWAAKITRDAAGTPTLGPWVQSVTIGPGLAAVCPTRFGDLHDQMARDCN